LSVDLAGGVIAPRYRIDERPPRILPWGDVQRILRAIPRSHPPGKRDFAILLLLATYGLGAAEVLGLRLEDVDWPGGILSARRPKTNVRIDLPAARGCESIDCLPIAGTATRPIHAAHFSAIDDS
jgi:integrase/recombinase XerD